MQPAGSSGANWLPGGFGGNLQQPMGMIANLISQLYSMIAQWVQYFGQPPSSPSEAFYRDAGASSSGDPHQAFNGTRADGATQNTDFESMVGHQALVDSDLFCGGYKISTNITAPKAKGVTLNQYATLSSNFGRSQISMDNTGALKILEDGCAVSINNGQTLDIGNGQTISKNADASATLINIDGQGGTIRTTLVAHEGGLNVSASAHKWTSAATS